MPTFDLARAVSLAQVIVFGTYERTAGAAPNPTATFLVKAVIKGEAQTGVISIDLRSPATAAGWPGQTEVALLDKIAGVYRPATLAIYHGQYSFLPAELPGPAGAALARVTRALGEYLADEAQPPVERAALLDPFFCSLPQAMPYLITASGSSSDRIRYGALGCRLMQGDMRPLPSVTALSVTSSPQPAASSLPFAVELIRNPRAVPFLLEMARNGRPAFRLAALDALWPNHPPAAAAIPVYRKALLDGTPPEQNAAVQGLIALHGGEVSEYNYFTHHRQEVIKDWLERTKPRPH